MTVRRIVPIDGPIDAVVTLPGSKSITNRALLCAALAAGESTLRGVLRADDTEAMIGALHSLGVGIDATDATTMTVAGIGGALPADARQVFANQSGTTARFVAPVLAVAPGTHELDAAAQMRARPMGPLFDALRDLGAVVDADDDQLPATIGGPCRGGEIDLPGHVSSQFLSGLMMAGPLMPDGLRIRLVTPLVSRPYVTMTAAVAGWFGASIEVEESTVTIAPTGYVAADVMVEPDASSASYFFAAAAICGGRVRVEGLSAPSLQGDAAFADVLAQMGAEVQRDDGGTEVRARRGDLTGVDIDLADLSDTAPTLAAVAAFADSATTVRGVGFIRAKESDRVKAVVTELRRCGVGADEIDDGFVVRPAPVVPAMIETYDDHRMAMAFALVGLGAEGIEIAGAECVAKTFPSFFEHLEQLRPSASTSGATMTDSDLLIVAIDGPAGSGKSTVARAVAERLEHEYLDTGAMYRAVAFAVLQRGIDPADADRVAEVARSMRLEVRADGVTVDGTDATVEIRGPEVTRSVSLVAANSAVRAELVERQREWARRRGGGVLEGRDIGTVVFPDARIKVYLTARPEVRAERRSKEVTDLDYETVAADLAGRDAADQNRKDSPLVEAGDAIVIDTSDLSIDAAVNLVVELLR